VSLPYGDTIQRQSKHLSVLVKAKIESFYGNHVMKVFALILSLSLFLITPSCQKVGEVSPHVKKQSISINFTYSPLSFDPRKSTDPVTTVMNLMLYEGLTRLEPDGKVSLALAKDVTVSKSNTTYLFYLRKAHWSDGTPITAHDFEASWKSLLDPNFPSRSAHLLFSIKNAEEAKRRQCGLDEVGVKALDATTLCVELKKPIPYFLELTSFCAYFPVPFKGREVSIPSQNQKGVFSGPFALKSWANDYELVVQKNPHYWNARGVKLDEIRATIVTDEMTAFRMYEQGQLDWIGGLISPLPLNLVVSLKNTFKLRQRSIAGTTMSVFNTHAYPFNNLNIRKAFAYAISRKEIVENVSQMFDDVATGLVPHVLKNGDPGLFFPDNAQVLARKYFKLGLKELNIKRESFPPVVYSYFTSELQRNLALFLQETWRQVLGVKVELRCSDLKVHLATLHSRNFQFAQMSWIGQYYDQMNFLERFRTKGGFRNYSGWEDLHYDQLIERSFYEKHEERNVLLNRAERYMIDNMPIIPLYHYHLIYMENPSLKDVIISPLGDIQFYKAFLSHEKSSSK